MTQRTSTDIAADLVDYRAARSALVKGERVTDVMRDGRRMGLATLKLSELEDAIASLDREYAQAVAVEAGGSKRRAIGLRYRN